MVFDAAHALGSARGGRPIGSFGAAEVFSLSPTKVVVAGEGGIVATADPDLAATIRMGRDYGNPGDYDTRFPGLNARMSELHAALALASFSRLDEHIAARVALVDRFEAAVAGVPGLRVIRPADGDTSTFKDLTVVVDAHAYGLSAPELQRALDAEGIDSRRYFHPPIHRQRAYQGRWADPRPLPVTEQLASSVLSPPLWSHLEPAVMDTVAADLRRAPRAAPTRSAARSDRRREARYHAPLGRDRLMDLNEYLRLLRRRWRLLAACVLVAGVAAWVTTPANPKHDTVTYTATHQLLRDSSASSPAALGHRLPVREDGRGSQACRRATRLQGKSRRARRRHHARAE